MPFGLGPVLDMGVHVGSLLGGTMEGIVFHFIDENFNRLGWHRTQHREKYGANPAQTPG